MVVHKSAIQAKKEMYKISDQYISELEDKYEKKLEKVYAEEKKQKTKPFVKINKEICSSGCYQKIITDTKMIRQRD